MNHTIRRPVLVWLVTAALVAVSAVALGAPRESSPLPGRQATALSDAPFGTYLGTCRSSSDCGQGLYCYEFKKQGAHCTKACASSTECGAPSKGCSERHQCSLPE